MVFASRIGRFLTRCGSAHFFAIFSAEVARGHTARGNPLHFRHLRRPRARLPRSTQGASQKRPDEPVGPHRYRPHRCTANHDVRALGAVTGLTGRLGNSVLREAALTRPSSTAAHREALAAGCPPRRIAALLRHPTTKCALRPTAESAPQTGANAATDARRQPPALSDPIRSDRPWAPDFFARGRSQSASSPQLARPCTRRLTLGVQLTICGLHRRQIPKSRATTLLGCFPLNATVFAKEA